MDRFRGPPASIPYPTNRARLDLLDGGLRFSDLALNRAAESPEDGDHGDRDQCEENNVLGHRCAT